MIRLRRAAPEYAIVDLRFTGKTVSCRVFALPRGGSTAGDKSLGGIAQLVEHRPFKPLVPGSSPGAPTTAFQIAALPALPPAMIAAP